MKRDISSSMTGRIIKEIRVMSFYINCKLICDVIVLYIRIDSGEWYKFTSVDGQNVIEELTEEPKEILLEEIKDEFAYPVKTMNLNYSNKRIEGIKEYLWKNLADEANGFYIALADGTGFSLFEDDDCLKISDGIRSDDHYYLSPFVHKAK